VAVGAAAEGEPKLSAKPAKVREGIVLPIWKTRRTEITFTVGSLSLLAAPVSTPAAALAASPSITVIIPVVWFIIFESLMVVVVIPTHGS